MEDVFTLSWDNFNQKCPKVFKELWLDTELSDVTLATEDNAQLPAHKVILAASSPFFKRLHEKNQNRHPLLFLMGVKMVQLRQLLSYIYLGKCDLTQEQLSAFMATGKQLEIEGLSGEIEESKEYHSPSKINGQESYSSKETPELSANFEESKERVSQSQAEELDSPIDEQNEAMEQTNWVDREDKCLQTPVTKNEVEISNTDIISLKDASKRWKCDQCDYQTSSPSHLRQHTQNVHEGLKYDCTSCDYKSGDKSNLKRHIEKNHLGVTYACQVCKHVTRTKDALKKHTDVKHNGLFYNCDTCSFKTTKKLRLQNHVMVHHYGITFDCHLCNHKNNTKQGLRDHIQIEHEGLRYECLECDRVFTRKFKLKEHVKMVHKLRQVL